MFKNNILILLPLLFFTSLMVGCVTTMGHQIDQDAFSQIHKGVSTKDDVINLLGKPTNEAENEDGTSVFQYTFVKSSTGIYGIGAGTATQTATIRFDANGVVIAKSKANTDTGATGAGTGLDEK